jgi:hypothetical protein
MKTLSLHAAQPNMTQHKSWTEYQQELLRETTQKPSASSKIPTFWSIPSLKNALFCAELNAAHNTGSQTNISKKYSNPLLTFRTSFRLNIFIF